MPIRAGVSRKAAGSRAVSVLGISSNSTAECWNADGPKKRTRESSANRTALTDEFLWNANGPTLCTFLLRNLLKVQPKYSNPS
jgi:hypothetical protein